MFRYAYLILGLSIFFQVAEGQGIINDQPKMLFSNERTVGAFLNSNGIGLDFRFAKYVDVINDRLYEISLDYVRDPKEYKTLVSYDSYYSRRFVYGKENLFWELKGLYGHQHEIFRKYDFSSISIRTFYSGGLALGFQKPIYYEIITYSAQGLPQYIEEKKFDPSIHLYNYGGTASFTRGFDEIKLNPGITGKAGLSFEYSEREPMVHALEAGIGITAYLLSVEIMNTQEQSPTLKNHLFFKFFVGYRFGTLLDISDAALAKSRWERRKERKEASSQPGEIVR